MRVMQVIRRAVGLRLTATQPNADYNLGGMFFMLIAPFMAIFIIMLL
jgi:hypothetical protein